MRGLSLTKKEKKLVSGQLCYSEVVIGVKLILKHVGGASTCDSCTRSMSPPAYSKKLVAENNPLF